MRLRNKNTGEIFDVAFHSSYEDEKIVIGVKECEDPVYPKCNFCDYDSLAELNEEWEDYEQKEPLIKDEVSRNAIRIWAREQDIKEVVYDDHWYALRYLDFIIKLWTDEDLEDGKTYTIEELCGEEEDDE